MAANRPVDTQNERGETLIEILISVVILSIGVVGIGSAIANSLSSANRLSGRAEISQVVTRVADAIQRDIWRCEAVPTASYQATLEALRPSAAWTIAVTSMEHWGASGNRSFGPGCLADPPFPAPPINAVYKTLKMVVTVTAPGNRGTQKVELIKRPT